MVATTVLGSSVAMLTSTVVNVALPRMAADLGASSAEQQWVVNAYLLTLAALILVGGSIGDRLGRLRIYRLGVSLFAITSIGAALAASVEVLIGFRLVQGVGGALLTPGSLAIIEASIRPSDRSRAIGVWAGLGGVAAAIGPLVGGLLVEISWRWVFIINVPVAAAVWLLAARVPESRDPEAESTPIDVTGAVLTVVFLGGVTFGLIPRAGYGSAEYGALAVSGAAGMLLALVEPHRRHAMVPLDLFATRAFAAANAVTFLVYAGLGSVFFLLSIQLQVTAGWRPLSAGAALLPVTGILLVLSPKAGDLAQRIGPRWPLSIGPVVMASGILLLIRVDGDAEFVRDVLPATVVFGLGLAASVAPVTSTALRSVPDARSGAASGANNAVARTGQLLAVAAVPPLAGLSGDALSDADQLGKGFPTAMMASAVLVFSGAVAAAMFLRSHDLATADAADPDA